MAVSASRYAVYLAPPAGSCLERQTAAWLGRDLAGRPVARPALGLDDLDGEALTRSPRHYGVHATLKPPFALAEGTTPEALEAALAALAGRLMAFTGPRLEVAALGSFLALRPVGPAEALEALAAACVTDLDRFRAPPSPADLDKRRAAGLTPRQDALLGRWGYPYVLQEFRFHMTLTGPIPDPATRERVRTALAAFLAPALHRPLEVGDIALYDQPDRDSPFVLRRRVPLHGGALTR